MELVLSFNHISRSFGPLEVLCDFSAELRSPGLYCLSAPSGAGKTTLFRLIMGLEKPDSGFISPPPSGLRFSAVFQEDRLIEHLSPVENVALVLAGNRNRDLIREEMKKLLPEEALFRPVCTLSGGMKRRCSFLRAMLAPSDVVIMDEPFTGLDDETKKSVIGYLLSHLENRLFLIATHDAEDIKALGGMTLTLDGKKDSYRLRLSGSYRKP